MEVIGMVSFGHAAYFGLGADGAALLLKLAGLPMPAVFVVAPLVAALAAAVFGYFCVRLTSIYFAIITLACAEIVYAIVHQWDDVTGGDNGVLSVWPASWLASPGRYYYWALVATVAGIVLLRRVASSPFGLTLRAARDHSRRAEALGVNIRALQWTAFVVAGFVAGIGGGGFSLLPGRAVPGFTPTPPVVQAPGVVVLGGIAAPSPAPPRAPGGQLGRPRDAEGGDPRPDRSQRGGQDHVVQHAHRPAPGRRGIGALQGAAAQRAAAVRGLAPRGEPDVPDHRHLRHPERARQRPCRAPLARGQDLFPPGGGRPSAGPGGACPP